MLKPRNAEERQRRLMGPLLKVFDLLYGKSWATLLGVVILVALVLMSLPGRE